ncbi:unnamed protein product, partial [Cladocopium goreaui]
EETTTLSLGWMDGPGWISSSRRGKLDAPSPECIGAPTDLEEGQQRGGTDECCCPNLCIWCFILVPSALYFAFVAPSLVANGIYLLPGATLAVFCTTTGLLCALQNNSEKPWGTTSWKATVLVFRQSYEKKVTAFVETWQQQGFGTAFAQSTQRTRDEECALVEKSAETSSLLGAAKIDQRMSLFFYMLIGVGAGASITVDVDVLVTRQTTKEFRRGAPLWRSVESPNGAPTGLQRCPGIANIDEEPTLCAARGPQLFNPWALVDPKDLVCPKLRNWPPDATAIEKNGGEPPSGLRGVCQCQRCCQK